MTVPEDVVNNCIERSRFARGDDPGPGRTSFKSSTKDQ